MKDDVAVPASALEALPIFPLRGVVLFPGGLLPLHVFEPRYRAMLRDCLATSRCMAMAFVLDDDPGVDPAAPPRIAAVAGVGLVVHHTMLDDGRSNLVLEGQARVALDELPFVPPYRRARARILDDIETPVAAHDVTGLFAVATAFAAATHQTDFMLPSGVGPGRAADLCAHSLMVDARTRQQVLEDLDVGARVRRVTGALAEQLGRVEREGRRGGGSAS
jgi:Lon protease-like protein